MLFRLKMSIDAAIDAYGRFAEHVFSKRKWLFWQEGTFEATRLEEAVVDVIVKALGVSNTDAKNMGMADPEEPNARGYVLFRPLSFLFW